MKQVTQVIRTTILSSIFTISSEMKGEEKKTKKMMALIVQNFQSSSTKDRSSFMASHLNLFAKSRTLKNLSVNKHSGLQMDRCSFAFLARTRSIASI